jgi:PPM family protein phosphatase
VPAPGGPQLLTAALAPADERLGLEAFYGQVLALKQRFARAAATVALEVASATTVGLNPTRLVNEDSCGYVTWSVSGAEGVVYRALLCVADGMGGMEAGEVASGTALGVVLSATTTPPPPSTGAGTPPDPGQAERLDPVALIREAAPVVHAAGQGRQMGTTCTVVAVHGDELTLGHVGDTRAYLLREGTLTRLTNDHSLVAAMVASGVLTPEEARGHPDSNKVLRSLGGQRDLPEGYVDSLEPAYGQPALRLRPGDWVLLCTDGIWGSVDDESIREVTVAAPDPQTVARVLVERALEAGAPDNAAVVAARCVQVPSA